MTAIVDMSPHQQPIRTFSQLLDHIFLLCSSAPPPLIFFCIKYSGNFLQDKIVLYASVGGWEVALICAHLQPTSTWLNFTCAYSLCLLQGDRGLPGPSGPQGVQGCPGLRGVKVGLSVARSLFMQIMPMMPRYCY